MVVDRADDFLGVPGIAHLPAGVASLEQARETHAALVIEAFVSAGKEPAGAVERVVFVAPVSEGLVLDPAADLVESSVRELHQMERVSDLHSVREHRRERQAPRPDRSRVARLIASSQAWSRLANQAQAPPEDLPGITSRSCPRRTSTIEVDHARVRQRPSRANNRDRVRHGTKRGPGPDRPGRGLVQAENRQIRRAPVPRPQCLSPRSLPPPIRRAGCRASAPRVGPVALARLAV